MTRCVSALVLLVLLFTTIVSCHGSRLLRSKHSTALSKLTLRSNGIVQLLLELSPSANKQHIEKITGYTFGTYMGRNTFIMRAPTSSISTLQNTQGIVWVGQYKAKHKYLRSEWLAHEQRVITNKNKALLEHDAKHLLNNDNIAQQRNKQGELLSHGRHVNDNASEKLFIMHVLLEKSIATSKRSMQHVQTIAHALFARLQRVVQKIVRTVPISEEKIAISILSDNFDQVLKAQDALAQDDQVHLVELAPVNQLHNQWAKMNTQSGFGQANQIDSVMKLMGAGQIVGVGDSGLESNSCYFYDSAPFPIVNATAIKGQSAHRKIHGIWPLVDNLAEDVAHGTHVSGTVLGNAVHRSLAEHNGMAPHAKLLFVDIGCTNPGGCRCNGVPCECDMYPDFKCPNSSRYVWLPLDLNKHYFPFFYDSQARIQTNSWGGGSGFMGYSSSSREIDQFTWAHKDFTVLFSAGNSGDDYVYASLGTQAESKNAIAVGASMNNLQMFKFNAENVVDFDALAKRYATMLMSLLGCESNVVCYYNGTIDPSLAKTKQTCDFLKTFTTQADCCSKQGPFCNTTSSCGCSLYSLGGSCCKTCFAQRYTGTLAQRVYNQENLAYFSSRGPTVDGRIKPDVLAPGYSLLSARSVDSVVNPTRKCQVFNDEPVKWSDHLASMGGTSMSCPATAGNVALVRQYFMDGWYDGTQYLNEKPSNTAGFVPSSALIKATLIDSGRELNGYLDMFGSLIKIHADPTMPQSIYLNTKFVEGFGLVQLHQTLNNKERRVLLGRRDEQVGHDPVIKTGQRHVYCIQVGTNFVSDQSFKASLSWTDYPSSPAAQSSLVNNLDLIVRDSNDDLLFGNNAIKNSNARDFVNNVEQVVIAQPKSGDYVVIVEGAYVPEGPQDYALVMSGQIKFRTCKPGENDTNTHSDKGNNNNNNNNSTCPPVNYTTYAVVLIFAILLQAVIIGVVVVGIWLFIRNRNKAKELETKGIPLQDVTE